MEAPIIDAANQVLFNGKSPAEEVSALMQRDKKNEINGQMWND